MKKARRLTICMCTSLILCFFGPVVLQRFENHSTDKG